MSARTPSDVGKKQSTLLTFFRPGGEMPKVVGRESTPKVEIHTMPTTDNTPEASKDSPLECKSRKGRNTPGMTKRKKKSTTPSSASSSCSSSSDDSSTGSSASESELSSDASTPLPVSKKARKQSVTSPPAVDTVCFDGLELEAMFVCGVEQNESTMTSKGRSTRIRFEQPSSGNMTSSESQPSLSVEEIEKQCAGVPPYVATLTRYYYEYCNRFDFPSWLNPQTLKDKHKRSPTDPDYDTSTLWIPRKGGKVVEEGHGTPMLQQYWDIKEDHFCEVILFKVGKFYEFFYMDACIGQAVCGLKWMGHNKRAHVGFPEVSLQHHATTLIEHGYTVCVVEQTETVSEANERAAQSGRKSSGALVERKICEMFTSGTLIHETMSGKGTLMIAAVVCGLEGRMGLVLGECASGRFCVARPASVSDLKTILYSYQPKEILFNPKTVDSSVLKLLGGIRESTGCVLSRWTHWTHKGSSLFPVESSVPPEVEDFVATSPETQSAVGGVLSYLEHLLLAEQVTLCSYWTVLEGPRSTNSVMILDSTVLNHLEILRDSENGTKGSLLRFLDRTSTPFGARLLRRWVCCPLTDVGGIEARLDAVEWFLGPGAKQKGKIVEKFSKLVDLERKMQRICAQALQQARAAVFFSEMENKRIGGFLEFLASVQEICGFLEWLNAENPPEILKNLSDLARASLIREVCSDLASAVQSRNGQYLPRPGYDAEYDSGVAAGLRIQTALEEELGRIRKELGVTRPADASYVSVKFKYEVELSVELESRLKKHHSLLTDGGEITSSRKGFVRFQTSVIQTLVRELEENEQHCKDLLYPFMSRLFSQLNVHKVEFLSLIERVAIIDVLVSFARVPTHTWARPTFGNSSSPTTIRLTQARHPIQEHLLQAEGKPFVPNDVLLSPEAGLTILVTGANMGGKSTMLRLVCLNVILAQIGCFVPAAECFISSPVDRVFSRIGASDNILEGKSTFLTELEETASILNEASARSLVVIDELGRGTSTFDGVAIAGATLDHISEIIKCPCLFATHYHRLCNSTTSALFHMECIVKPGAEIELTHKFKAGQYPHSQAMHVARIAGIPAHILAQAEEVSNAFHECARA